MEDFGTIISSYILSVRVENSRLFLFFLSILFSIYFGLRVRVQHDIINCHTMWHNFTHWSQVIVILIMLQKDIEDFETMILSYMLITCNIVIFRVG